MLSKYTSAFLLFYLLSYSLSTYSQKNTCEAWIWDWAKNFGPGTAIDYDSDNNLYVGGFFFDSLSLGDTNLIANRGRGGYVAKYTQGGTLLWAQAIQEQTKVVEFTVVENSYFLLLEFDTVGYATRSLGKYDLEGRPIWVSQVGKAMDGFFYLTSIAAGKNEVYIAGNFSGTIEFEGEVLVANGEQDGILAKYSTEGHALWVQQLTSAPISEIALNSKGDIFGAGGFFSDTLYFGQDTLKLVFPTTEYGGMFVKYSSEGVALSAEYVAKAPGYSYLTTITIDQNDNISVGGVFDGLGLTADTSAITIIGTDKYKRSYSFVAGYNNNENFVWSDTIYQGRFFNSPDDLTHDKENNVYLLENDMSENVVLKYSSKGDRLWKKVIAEINETFVSFFNMTLSPDENKIGVAGSFLDSISFGDTTFYTDYSGEYLAQMELSSTLSAPKKNPSAVKVSSLTGTSLRLSWQKGDGTGSLVLLKKLGRVSPSNIKDGRIYEDGGGLFGAGSQTAEREYVVFTGIGSEFSLTGLQPGRLYELAVIEYNDSSSCPSLTNYLQESSARKIFHTPGRISGFSAYPNPFSDNIIVVLLPENTPGDYVLRLQDANGEKILQRSVRKLSPDKGAIRIDIAELSLASGIYYLSLTGQRPIRLIKN